jgi:Uncharacterized Fe-S center protein
VTSPQARTASIEFCKDDLVIFAVPVYIGRVPNLIKPWLATVKGNGAFGVPVVVYGNRNFDDALVELYDMLCENGFVCTAAAAFVGEHSFSTVLGAGRPDARDLVLASTFGRKVAGLSEPMKSTIPGHRPYQFYKAVDDDGHPFDIRKAKPVTDASKCTNCGLCASLCPMGSIATSDPAVVEGICIKCGACIKRCPAGAKRFIDAEYLRHLAILERNFASIRREPQLFW